ncbi:MAG TPA: alpha/beta hydrolase [Pseudonocardiaceae bacterium]|nr:alpha/beta hydrolase [Pseudonocardiaceae bacterium]
MLVLPAPTGPHPVGTTSLYLRDDSRPDPWVPDTARELMATLWFPAHAAGERTADYMTPAVSRLFLGDAGLTSMPLDVLSTVRTNAFADAEPLGRTLPLIVLSPGYTKPRGTLTSLAEDLASHGYAVVAIDHTYENVATGFPDGRVTTCVSGEGIRGLEFWGKLADGRAADVSFVIDELIATYPELVDADRIAMVGHSAGGASATRAMVNDARIRAGADIDGTTSAPIPETGLARPFLFLGKDSNYTPGSGPAADTWARDWQRLTGWRRWILVAGALHASFTDVGLMGEQLGLGPRIALPATRVAAITRDYVRAFTDVHLCGENRPILDGPSSGYPEVSFHDLDVRGLSV